MARRASASQRPVELDLAIDLGAVDDAALNDRGVVGGQAMHDRGDVGHRAAHRDQRVGNRAPIDAREVGRNGRQGLAQHLGRHGAVEPVALGVAHGADVDAEALVDAGVVAERELRTAAAGVEDDERALVRVPGRPSRPRRPAGLPPRPRSPRCGCRCAPGWRRRRRWPFDAMRSPAVPTAAIARTPFRFASSTMPSIAATVRSSAASTIAPCGTSPSPRRVISARSTTVRHWPARRRARRCGT